ncbi:HTH-type transcriptional repressor CsiR [Pigmentiphaga humi]|uniref:HTH-type transcriptional repressor CsiR n=1 Tax=Pigmentiphaga humi TaxID=2478468 RepID=A0A3P4AW02_9BURK|nr:GntR family transcriptional regulator [Pigmentiphaga humi]VCU68197.1 HTH-type transcriptional repressor CsiR [Pigmentiphaga humi]
MSTDRFNSLRSTEARTKPGGAQTTAAELGLRELILSGELTPGNRLSEPSVADRLGISRTPIRAAMARLEDEGLLELIPSGGYAVKAFTEAEIRDSVEVRGTMEGLAVRIAAERGVAAGDIEAMRDCLAEIDTVLKGSGRSVADLSRYIELNRRFHQMLHALPGSAVLERQIARATNLPFASPNGFLQAQADSEEAWLSLIVAQDQHWMVLSAIEDREGARAEAIMREHARIALRNMQSVLRNQHMFERIPGARLIRRRILR